MREGLLILGSVLEKLAQFEARGIKKVLDIYFYDPQRTDLQPDESGRTTASFRLRQSEEGNTITYKHDHFEQDMWSHSDEYETMIGDIDTGIEILEHLGLRELVRVANEKHVFLTPEYEIVLEDVENLGLFLEIEKREQVADDAVAQTKDAMRVFLHNLGITFGEELNAGKPELLLRKQYSGK